MKKFLHGLGGDGKIRSFIARERRDFRREPNNSVRHGIKERTLPSPIAREYNAFGARIPDRDGENANKPLHECFAQLQVKLRDNSDVRLLGHIPAALAEPTPQFPMVVDLSIANGDNAANRIDNRLLSGAEAAYCKPGGAENRNVPTA